MSFWDRRIQPQEPIVTSAPPPAGLSKPERASRAFTLYRTWTRFINTMILLAVILYFGALLLSRTQGFADIVRGHLDKRLGMTFTIGHAALTPRLDLVLQNVSGSVTNHSFSPGVSAGRIVVSWHWLDLLPGGSSPLEKLRAENADLHFALDSQGHWQPSAFADVSRWFARRLDLDLERYALLAASVTNGPMPNVNVLDIFAERRVELSHALVHWQVEAGREIARADGIEFASSRIVLSNREMTHFLATIGDAMTGRGLRLHDKQIEMIETAGSELWIEGVSTNAPAVRHAQRAVAPAVVTDSKKRSSSTNGAAAKNPAAVSAASQPETNPPVPEPADPSAMPGPEE